MKARILSAGCALSIYFHPPFPLPFCPFSPIIQPENRLSRHRQEEQSASFKVAQKELVALEAKKTDTTKFIDLVRKYSQITELTPQILNEFIDKVTVHQAVKVDGKRRQDIEVYFNGVGLISSDAEKKPETTE